MSVWSSIDSSLTAAIWFWSLVLSCFSSDKDYFLIVIQNPSAWSCCCSSPLHLLSEFKRPNCFLFALLKEKTPVLVLQGQELMKDETEPIGDPSDVRWSRSLLPFLIIPDRSSLSFLSSLLLSLCWFHIWRRAQRRKHKFGPEHLELQRLSLMQTLGYLLFCPRKMLKY